MMSTLEEQIAASKVDRADVDWHQILDALRRRGADVSDSAFQSIVNSLAAEIVLQTKFNALVQRRRHFEDYDEWR